MYFCKPAHVRVLNKHQDLKHTNLNLFKNFDKSDIKPLYTYSHLHYITSTPAKPKRQNKNTSN